MSNWLRTIPFHLFVFATLRILHVYGNNIDKTPFVGFARLFAVALLVATVIWAIVYILIRHSRRSAIVSTIIVMALYFSGDLVRDPLLGIGVSVAFVLFIWKTHRAQGDWFAPTLFLNVTGLLTTISPLFLIAIYAVSSPPVSIHEVEGPIESTASPESSAELPNIYHIVLDGYARDDVLRELYDFDNTSFLEFLEGQDFDIARNAQSNYCQTFLSLGSTLNLVYLDALLDANKHMTTKGNDIVIRALQNSRLVDFLRLRNYSVISTASGFSPTEFNSADIQYAPDFALSEFEHAVLKHSLPVHLAGLRRNNFSLNTHRTRIRSGFEGLENAPKLDGRKFVFMHFICPHPPFVFNEDGSPVEEIFSNYFATVAQKLVERMSVEEYRKRYVAQLRYVNSLVENAVTRIRKDDPSAIIIIQGDHGPGSEYHTDSFEKTNMHERFSILYAAHLPGSKGDLLADDATPVNMYRLILNQYFDTQLPSLPNQSIYSTEHEALEFLPVNKTK